MSRPRTERPADMGALLALAHGDPAWLLVERSTPVGLHVGSEAAVREALVEWLGEPWPSEWSLVPVATDRSAAALADARREVAELDAERDRLTAQLAAARSEATDLRYRLGDAAKVERTLTAELAAREQLAAGLPGIGLGIVTPGERPPRSDRELLPDLLLLVLEEPPSAEVLAGWSEAQVGEVAGWASATHLAASDNDDVAVPERPACLVGYR